MIENCIDMDLNIRDIKGLTDEDIKRHINEIVYCYYSLNKEVPNDLLFNEWYKQPFINYHPLDVKQYTPLSLWLIFNHNNTKPPKEFYDEKGLNKTFLNKDNTEISLWVLYIRNYKELPP